MKIIHRQYGFSLIEVMVSLVILTVGILAAVRLQAASLNITQDSRDLERAITIAEAEIEHQRSISVPVAVSATVDGYTRTTVVLGCLLNTAGSTLTCNAATPCVADSPACQIDVTVDGGIIDSPVQISTIKAVGL
ncbi:prepilin-type N-terminal cleavage/methylation domain-containing protein [Synechococcus sp. PCC 7336]|uniref:type IV pilus modification PilV family protein n=1 Tax=Synechococcus sp. PCC 7336 TaxID=195250 RepID=UPI0003494D93|nr:prepilin-type N-terminal cleavage/methylation domain-containing protein [Synechococcus sp. PCC 7336]